MPGKSNRSPPDGAAAAAPRLLRRCAIVLSLGVLSATAVPQDLEVEGAGGGDAAMLCTVLGIATSHLAPDRDYAAARADEDRQTDATTTLYAEMLTEVELETGVKIAEVDPAVLVAAMAEIEAEAEPQPAAAGGQAEAEQWTAFDISRTALAVASIADPTGLAGIAAAYTYPICGTEDADRGSGGYCWKESTPRGAGSLPRDLGKVANCPAGFRNFGLTCTGGGDSIAAASQPANCPEGFRNVGLLCSRAPADIGAPSLAASCPAGFDNMGLFCLRPASTYPQASRMADCPSGYTNLGATCTRGADSFGKGCTTVFKEFPCPAGYTDMGCHCQRWADTQGLSAMSCRAGEFRSGGRCYRNCRPGYTNNGEFCGRGAQTVGAAAMSCPAGYSLNTSLGRCYKQCPPGYTNTGETCHRPLATLTASSMSCPAGHTLNADLGRCYRDCPAGYQNTGETCFRPLQTLGTEAMSCDSGQFLSSGRCYAQSACAARDGPAGKGVMDVGLCYPACPQGEQGIGPVCWSQCGGKLPVACAAGCAATAADCGLATVDMVASPFEAVASIVSLGGYSAAKSARKAATLAARQGVKQGIQLGASRIAQGSLREALGEAAQVAGDEAARAAGRTLAQRFAKSAADRAARAARIARNIDARYTYYRNLLKSRIVDYAKRAGKVVADPARTAWSKVTEAVMRGEPQRQAWKRVHPDGITTFGRITREMLAVRSHAKGSAFVRAESLARSCTKFGLTVDRAMIE